VTDRLLAGKLAVVTGASRGIGLAIGAGLRAGGAHVVRLARSLRDRVAENETDLACDLTDAAAVDRVVTHIRTVLGVPDILVNNAGVFLVRPVEETSPDEFARTLSTNVTGAFLIAHALLPAFKERASGHLVTIGSVADHVGFPGSSAYAASKFGLRGLHEALTAELAGTGVRTTLVSPGPVDTALWDEVDPDRRPGFTKRRDMLLAGDVAEAVVFAVTRPSRVAVTELRLAPAGYRARV
jgi:NADP-dependent 3-hydroxy acid dehydrogenase YdfG